MNAILTLNMLIPPMTATDTGTGAAFTATKATFTLYTYASTAPIPTVTLFPESFSCGAGLATEIVDGRIEWPADVQPPAWFATAAQALVDEEATR